MIVLEILEEAVRDGVGLGVDSAGNIAWVRQGPLPDGLRQKIIAKKPELVAALSRKPCRELGRVLRHEEMISLGVNPATCGCGGKIRFCNYHNAHCTGTIPRTGFLCCAVCDGYEPADS